MRNNRAYTLIEMSLVLAIIAILASVVMINVSRERDNSRDKALIIEINNIRAAINNYRLIKNGKFPPDLESLEPKYIKNLHENWYGSKGYGIYKYDNKSGELSLKVIAGSNRDSLGREYESY